MVYSGNENTFATFNYSKMEIQGHWETYDYLSMDPMLAQELVELVEGLGRWLE